ncbi:N-6 DNA methylase [Streptomyces albidoflavus]
MSQPVRVTASEISRIAGVTRATVSNWRRRHADFPAPSGGDERHPLYELGAVLKWLSLRGYVRDADAREGLRTAILSRPSVVGRAAARIALVLALDLSSESERTALAALPDSEFAARAGLAAADVLDSLPGSPPKDALFAPGDAEELRAVLRCVRECGGMSTLDVLAEHERSEVSTTQHATPAPLAQLMAGLLPGSAARVLDPACGGGALLVAAARRGIADLLAQDLVDLHAQRTAAYVRLAAPEAKTTVRIGDSLKADAFAAITADAVLCHPPYGDRNWGLDELALDPRWVYGLPPRAESELAWVQHCLARLAPGGTAVVILPPAVASRPSGRRVRTELVRTGTLRAVMALPSGVARPHHLGLHLWVLEHPSGTPQEPGPVLFADLATTHETSAGGTDVRPQASSRPALDWPELTSRALDHWRLFLAAPQTFQGAAGAARAVPVVELLDGGADLTPSRRVRTSAGEADPATIGIQLRRQRSALTDAARCLLATTEGVEVDEAPYGNRQWRSATTADLARGGALHLLTRSQGANVEPTSGSTWADVKVLTAESVAEPAGPITYATDDADVWAPVVAVGDVLVRAVVGGRGPMARVADERDAGAVLGPQVHLLRPDPSRLDPWFLAGFLNSEKNVTDASSGTTVLRVAPDRLKVPLLPLDQQRRYGEAFRNAHDMRTQATRAARLAEEMAGLLAEGLAEGALSPPAEPPGPYSDGRPSTDTEGPSQAHPEHVAVPAQPGGADCPQEDRGIC